MIAKKFNIYEVTCLHPGAIASTIANDLQLKDPGTFASKLEKRAVYSYQNNVVFRMALRSAKNDVPSTDAAATAARDWLTRIMRQWAEELLQHGDFPSYNETKNSVKLKLAYNGDYPGFPCAWINERPVDSFEAVVLLRLFGLDETKGLSELMEHLGAEKSTCGTEYLPWEGVLELVARRQATEPKRT